MDTPLLSVDFHCHILPGIDDGAKTLEDSEALARRLLDEGISQVVCTSHIMADLYPNSRWKLLPLVSSTQAHFDAVGIPLKLIAGAEVRLDVESCIAANWLTIADEGKYMLVELPTAAPLIESLDRMLYDLQVQGITPIIAHPERMAFLQKDPTILARWVDRGCLAQGTMCVLGGGAGNPLTLQALETFLREGLIHVMGTDAHQLDRRLKNLRQAADRLTELVGPENARLIRFENPQAILDGREVRRIDPSQLPPPAEVASESLFKKLLAPFKRH